MNLIENYLKAHYFLDLNEKNDSTSREAKLEYFFHLFNDLEKKYTVKVEDMKRIEIEHKSELNKVSLTIFVVVVVIHYFK